MSLFTGFLGKRLPLAWEHTVQGVLWRLLPSASGLLVGEDRDVEAKKVSFFCLDERTGAAKWSGLAFPEQWWISMEALHADTLFLHEYAAPDMPDHKKIHAVDALTGAVRWTNLDAKFLFAHGAMVYSAKETYEERQFFEHAAADGALLRRVPVEEIRVLQGSLGGEYADIVTFPSSPQPGREAEPDLERALQTGGLRRPAALAEYVPLPGMLVVAATFAEDPLAERPSFAQRLIVFDRDRGRVVYDDVMHAALSMPVPDMFFVRDGCLFYIKERRTIRAVRVGREP